MSPAVNGFVTSDEFINNGYTNAESVEILYKAMLNRASDAGGKATWAGNLDAGQTLTDVVNGFCTSTEFGNLCNEYGITPGSVPTGSKPAAPAAKPAADIGKIRDFVTRCYQVILSRYPDEGGLNDWSNMLYSGKATAAQIVNGFVTSDEFRNRGYSDEESVEILYRAMLNRASDAGGKATWVANLQAMW